MPRPLPPASQAAQTVLAAPAAPAADRAGHDNRHNRDGDNRDGDSCDGEDHNRPDPVRARRLLVATPVTARVAGMLDRMTPATLRPDLPGRPDDLPAALVEHRPHTLVVGANPVPRSAIEPWVAAMRDIGDQRELLIIRRGTSLAEIDLTAAHGLGVTVRNTPEVNARHIARFVVEHLLKGQRQRPTSPTGTGPGTVGLLGAGDINSRVARDAVARGHGVIVHSPTLAADPDALDRWLARRRVPAGTVRVARDVEALLTETDLLAMAVPLTTGGSHPTVGMVDLDRLKRFAGHRIVSVCEPAVFTHDALVDAYGRLDVEIVLDNAPRLVAEVRELLANRVSAPGPPRRGFTLTSAAMRGPGCADDLDQAFLAVAARAELDDRRTAPPAPARVAAVTPPPVVVVGGGIVGLTIALLLRRQGRRVEVLDASPADRRRVDEQGTTFAGTNGRHLSATETMPHADGPRLGILDRPLGAGGWRLRRADTRSAAESAWAATFDRCADRPGLRAVTADLVIALNRLGLRGWSDLFAAYPDRMGPREDDQRLPRVYLSEAELRAGRELQARSNDAVRELAAADLARDWPALASSVALPGGTRRVAGALEVDGHAINIHDLAQAIGEELRADGVTVRAGARVHAVRTNPDGIALDLVDGTTVVAGMAVLTVGGRDLADLLAEQWPAARSVASVLGVSLTVPNPGLRRPLKIHAGEPFGVVNITLSPDRSLIHVSGGFGYLGQAAWRSGSATAQRAEADVPALLTMFTDAVAALLPGLRGPTGQLKILQARTCERPMTPDGLPIVAAPAGFDSRLVVAVGTNAGGAVQAPALAGLVADLLDGMPGCPHLAMADDRVGLPEPVDTPAVTS